MRKFRRHSSPDTFTSDHGPSQYTASIEDRRWLATANFDLNDTPLKRKQQLPVILLNDTNGPAGPKQFYLHLMLLSTVASMMKGDTPQTVGGSSNRWSSLAVRQCHK